jgi:hypothetical protein
MESKFKVWYDDDQMNVVDRVKQAIRPFGLEIVELEGGDGWIEYEIKKLPSGN